MAVPPSIKFHEFAVSGINPSGFRTLTTHPSFVKVLGTAASQYLNFGSKNISDGKQHSKTCAVVAFATAFNDANEAVFNLRLWVADFSDFDQGTFSFNGFPSGKWIQNLQLNDASGYFVPTALPSGQNWWRDGGGPFNRDDLAFQEFTGSGIDPSGMSSQVTMPFYLSVTVDTDVPPKVYGGDAGGFTYRLTFDYR